MSGFSQGVSAGGTTTLTNKTIDGDDNTFVDIPWSAQAAGTDGEIPTWGSDAEPATVSAGSSGQVLTSNGAGAAPTFQNASGGGNKTVYLVPGMGYTSGTLTSTAGDQPAAVVSFADGATNRWDVSWGVPDDFTSLTSVKVYLSDDAGSGNMYLEFNARAFNTGELVTSGGSTDGIAVTTYASAGTIREMQIIDVSAMSNGLTISANDIITFSIERQGADANDTIGDTVWVVAIQLVYA